MNNKIGIVHLEYITYQESNNMILAHRDLRIMDNFSKMAMISARRILEKVKADTIPGDQKCMVLATDTGPVKSLQKLSTVIKNEGFRGINPSMYPNIMLSTPMSRIAIDSKITGPSVVMYIAGKLKQALHYGALQIKKGCCQAALILYANDQKGCLGMFLEEEQTAVLRGLEVRFRETPLRH